MLNFSFAHFIFDFGEIHIMDFPSHSKKFRCYNIEDVWKLKYDFDSMEQLWLAFAMNRNYNKAWDDTKQEWISIKN